MVRIALTFDVEELRAGDHYNVSQDPVRFEESTKGLLNLLEVIPHSTRCTVFVTTTFARENPDLVERMIARGWEIGSHGVEDRPLPADDEQRYSILVKSKRYLEETFNVRVYGFRAPLMSWSMNLLPDLARAGYAYDSSLHPTWIPGRYAHVRAPRHAFRRSRIVEFPPAVLPLVRLPVSWWWTRNLSSNLPRLATGSGFDPVVLYYHPWEFVRLGTEFPWHIRRRTGQWMVSFLKSFTEDMINEGHEFVTLYDACLMGLPNT